MHGTPTNQPDKKKKKKTSLPATFTRKSPHTSLLETGEKKKKNCSTNYPEVNRPPSLLVERESSEGVPQSQAQTHTLFVEVLRHCTVFLFSRTLNWPGRSRMGGLQQSRSSLAQVPNKASLAHLRTQQPLRPSSHGTKKKKGKKEMNAVTAPLRRDASRLPHFVNLVSARRRSPHTTAFGNVTVGNRRSAAKQHNSAEKPNERGEHP